MSKKRYMDFFNKADVNHDGHLTLEELSDCLRQNGYRKSDKSILDMFRTIDTSGDGEISLDEYLKYMGVIPEKDHKSAIMRSVFLHFDKNRDGMIDMAELGEALREMGRVLSEEDLAKVMEKADTDKNGTLDYEEFIAQVLGN